ncbi:MAG: glycine cleavage T C-terminal barrel domain-containing protein, partial [Acidimicrobiales bacterium]
GRSELDITGGDIARFHAHQRTRAYVAARAAESFNKMYAVVHPAEQAESARQLRLSPFAARQAELGAHLVEAGGWERPHWYESNAPLLERYAGTVSRRPAEWDARWWSPIIDAEHLAMRERAGVVDLSAFCHFDITGPGALDHLQRLCVAQVDVAPGRVVYTSLLDERARMRADLTVMRLGERHFRVVTGASTGMLDRAWFETHLPEGGSAQLHDATSALSTIGLWGPEARRILARLTEADVSNDGFAFGTCRQVDLGAVPVLCSRISYVGELGWEIHVSVDAALGVWDRLTEAGEPSGLVPVGIGVYATTGRMEKSYRAYGTELTMDFDLVEAGMTRPRVKAADFIGRDAYLAQRDAEPAARLCTLTLDDPADPDDTRAMLGSEPVVERGGAPLVDRLGRRSYVTSAGYGPSVGKHLLMAYLPPEHAVGGTPLAVEYCGERHPATVAAVGAVPLFDPDNERVRS